MHRCFKQVLTAATLLAVALLPSAAMAQAEITPTIGYMIGSDINPEGGDIAAPIAISRSFQSSLAWGVRGGYFFKGDNEVGNIGIEGSFTQAPLAGFDVGPTEIDSRATYVDANMVVQSTGRFRFYGTAGMGLTRFRMGASEGGQTHTKLGINFGLGVKMPMWDKPWGAWGLRFDIRDQWLRMDADDSMRSGFRDQLLLSPNSSSAVHNWVTTIGFYFVFN